MSLVRTMKGSTSSKTPHLNQHHQESAHPRWGVAEPATLVEHHGPKAIHQGHWFHVGPHRDQCQLLMATSRRTMMSIVTRKHFVEAVTYWSTSYQRRLTICKTNPQGRSRDGVALSFLQDASWRELHGECLLFAPGSKGAGFRWLIRSIG